MGLKGPGSGSATLFQSKNGIATPLSINADPQSCFSYITYPVSCLPVSLYSFTRLPTVMRIRDVYHGSRILIFSIPELNFYHPGSRIRIKEYKYFNPKNCFYALGNMIRDVHPGSGSWIFYPSRIPDRWVSKAPDPGSGSATLFQSKSRIVTPLSVHADPQSCFWNILHILPSSLSFFKAM